MREKSVPRDLELARRRASCRGAIACKDCYCTNEVFLWPSIAFQPAPLAKAFIGARAWHYPRPLEPFERAPVGDPYDRSRLPAEAIAYLDDPKGRRLPVAS